jgi:hypothetical protein
MKDNTKILLRTVDDLLPLYSQRAFQWVVDNPGRQLFTGSFHPVSDTKWEDRRNWDKQTLPHMPKTFKDTFTYRVDIELHIAQQKAAKILHLSNPLLPMDIARHIMSFLDKPTTLKVLAALPRISARVLRAPPNSIVEQVNYQQTNRIGSKFLQEIDLYPNYLYTCL